MPCELCTAARGNDAHVTYTPACLYCGARYLQRLKSWPRCTINDKPETRDQRKAWRAKVLDDWAAAGHDRAELEALAASKAPVYEPATKGKM